MTPEEMKAMEGTEHTYIFEDGDTIPAYVKRFDIETGELSCWSFSLITDRGVKIRPLNKDEYKEGACCLQIRKNHDASSLLLEEIRDTGKSLYKKTENANSGFPGCIF